MNTFSDIDDVFREALFLHELFRKLGFVSNDIFVLVARVAQPNRALFHDRLRIGQLGFHVVLKAQGLEYAGAIGPLPVEESRIEEAWRGAVEGFNEADSEVLVSAWERSRIRQKTASILTILKLKGFTFPYMAN